MHYSPGRQPRSCLLLLTPVAFLACERAAPEAKRPSTGVRAVPARVELPRFHPLSEEWRRAPEHTVPLLPQDIALPKLTTPGVKAVRVRALHHGDLLSFRLEWEDSTRDVLAGPGISSDAAAVQLPLAPGSLVPDVAMGLSGEPVRIIYWKAAWQESRDPLAALYPNATVDHYPFQAAQVPAKDALALAYAPARAAGNPGLTRPEDRPVQDLLAEGFGTVEAAPEQRSSGQGEWRAGRWYLTLVGPMAASPPAPGKASYVAFAIWDGSHGEAGARKMRSAWVPLSVEGE